MQNPVRIPKIVGDLAFVPLTKGLECIIDANDVDLIAGRNWHACDGYKTSYAGCRFRLERGKSKIILLHRLLMEAPDGMHVDHIDGDGLNNRRENLRVVTHSENLHNRGPQSNNTSGFKGVTFCRSTGRWQAQISVRKVGRKLGRYDTPEEAALAYQREAEKIWA